jgi:hypothetical protein
MLNRSDLSAAFDAFERQTLDAIAQARTLELTAPFAVSFRTSELSEAEIKRIVNSLPTPTHKEKRAKSIGFLYVFAQKSNCSVPRATILKAIAEAKDGGADKAKAMKNLCAVNGDASKGRVLYVGRSWDPRTRIAGHLRSSTSRTYAIHFAAWAQKLEIDVELFVYSFPKIKDRVLQVVEDVTWDRLAPLFGRRGEK